MNAHHRLPAVLLLVLATLLGAGCANQPQPYDYTAFFQHPPHSILVLPPVNNTTHVEGTYGYYSTVTQPLAERGYYVYPVAVVDQFFKDQGLPGPAEMQQVPLAKVREILGADAVLLMTLDKYGQTYYGIDSVTEVTVNAKLYDTASEALIWEGAGVYRHGVQDGSSNPIAGMIAALIVQALSAVNDPAHDQSPIATNMMLSSPKRALPYGPYHPKAGQVE